ncbi:GxxExxY protein [Rhodopirellula rubra]|uniref:GxxExxY protein n=1 Tax=Aporhodopirellula rubra TaxID=980271 RepID=A0A7W5DV06_9BACT|nr:GxxExxY protein [Aporhodopirellula rubra]MBB3204568.1 GxxExxY protein [Aporhodopirellula rubra]
MAAILLKDESYKVMGALFEVYREMGCGYLESVYQECVILEFTDQDIPFASQTELTLKYKGHALNSKYIPDFICFGEIIVELKAVGSITDQHRAQVHNYLRATRHRLGIIANFGHHPKLEYERILR